ncbi:VOC family protein [Streptomyces sp. PKU-MA01144]|uniref:VOC family protein n=1 Tax=Streptomyces sp. PKU-MA01144 TaxID=2729138 RepID=UPI00147ADB09|nr:VOC family protein [Streptomyces sp. PKU-MA01144]NNJ07384.1 VOC family protein [Streptomyces sp. PKU-MA01144]
MLTTRYLTGSPNWLDLATPDLSGAASFYGGLFGWTFRAAGPGAGGYGMFELDGRTAAGGMTVAPEQGAPGWTLYFQSASADDTAERVRNLGGSVTYEPADVWDLGRMAHFTDPAGVGFATCQPRTDKGLDVVNETGSLCWAELWTPDPGAALGFYRSVFGWDEFAVPVPGGDTYVTVNPAGAGEDAMFAGLVALETDPVEAAGGPYWLPYFEVTDTDATAAEAEELGGTVRTRPIDLEDVGRIAKLADPYGARFAVIETSVRSVGGAASAA